VVKQRLSFLGGEPPSAQASHADFAQACLLAEGWMFVGLTNGLLNKAAKA
jgi:hypothetical protein